LRATLCNSNLERIEEAKGRWALANQKPAGAPVSDSAVVAYVKGGLPKCPWGGAYSFNAVGVAPACSLGQYHDLGRAPPWYAQLADLSGVFRFVAFGSVVFSAAALGSVGLVLFFLRWRSERQARKGLAGAGVGPAADVVRFTRQLATMLDAGLEITEALLALQEQTVTSHRNAKMSQRVANYSGARSHRLAGQRAASAGSFHAATQPQSLQ
jgi:hypothetical protein